MSYRKLYNTILSVHIFETLFKIILFTYPTEYSKKQKLVVILIFTII